MFRPFLLATVAGLALNASAAPAKKPAPSPSSKTRAVELVKPARPAVSPDTFTLDEAVAWAIEHNPTIRAARLAIERQRGVTIEIRAAAMPRVATDGSLTITDEYLLGGSSQNNYNQSVTSISGYSATGQPQFETTTKRVRFKPDRDQPTTEQWGVTMQITKNLYDGGATRASIAASKLDEEAARMQLAETIGSIINEVRITFYQCLLNKSLITVREQSVQVLSEQLTNQQQRYAAGVVPQFNVLQAEVALANEQPNLIIAKNNYRTSLQTLSRLMALFESYELPELTPDIKLVGNLEKECPKPNLSEALSAAQVERPQLLALDLNLMADKATLRSAQAGYLPTVDSYANYAINKDAVDTDFFQSTGGYHVGFRVNVPIWDGGQTRGRVIQSKAQIGITQATIEDTRRQVEFEVRSAFLNYLSSVELIKSQEKTVEQALEALRQSQARLDNGAGTQLDVLNARLQLTQAQSTVLQAWFAYQEAIANLRKATGESVRFLGNKTAAVTPTTSSSASRGMGK